MTASLALRIPKATLSVVEKSWFRAVFEMRIVENNPGWLARLSSLTAVLHNVASSEYWTCQCFKSDVKSERTVTVYTEYVLHIVAGLGFGLPAACNPYMNSTLQVVIEVGALHQN